MNDDEDPSTDAAEGQPPPPPHDPPHEFHRTAAPSDWEHTTILMRRTLRQDATRHRRIWMFRTLGGPALWMLYTLGFWFGNYNNNGSRNFVVDGNFRLYEGQALPLPQTLVLGGSASSSNITTYLEEVADQVRRLHGSGMDVVTTTTTTTANETTTYSFDGVPACSDSDVTPDRQVCVALLDDTCCGSIWSLAGRRP